MYIQRQGQETPRHQRSITGNCIPGYSMDGLTRRRSGCGIDKNPSHPPDAELKPALGMQGGASSDSFTEGNKAINNWDPGQRS